MNRIQIENLTKRFGQKTVFEHFNCTFEGQCVLMAPSGRGKTTLLRLMMGLENPDAGSISPVGRVAAVFQEDRLCPGLTAAANLRLVEPGLTDDALADAFARLELGGQDLTTPAGKLSGGQKRRVALLRALLIPADTVLLDEPFSGMDEGLIEKAARLTAEKTRDKLTVLVTHDPDLAGRLGWPVREL